MRTYDISLTISPDLPTWPGDPKIMVERFSKMEEGAACNVSQISACVHAGTHVDAPYHFLGGQAKTIDQIPLSILTGRTYLLHLPDEVDLITPEVLIRAGVPPRTRRLLFKTRNSAYWDDESNRFGENNRFREDFVAISPEGAKFIVNHGIKLVGVDYLSVAPFAQPGPTHEILLQAGIVVIEGLNLSQVSQGRYSLYCLPLKIAGADGAPARAILIGV
jgi:arylformamidase